MSFLNLNCENPSDSRHGVPGSNQIIKTKADRQDLQDEQDRFLEQIL